MLPIMFDNRVVNIPYLIDKLKQYLLEKPHLTETEHISLKHIIRSLTLELESGSTDDDEPPSPNEVAEQEGPCDSLVTILSGQRKQRFINRVANILNAALPNFWANNLIAQKAELSTLLLDLEIPDNVIEPWFIVL